MSDNQARRKRRLDGFVNRTAEVIDKPFVDWLVWDGLLDRADAGDKDKISEAHGRLLHELYARPDLREPPPEYTIIGSMFEGLRERKPPVGLLEREGSIWQWNDPPPRYLITARQAALRRAAPPVYATRPLAGRRIRGYSYRLPGGVWLHDEEIEGLLEGSTILDEDGNEVEVDDEEDDAVEEDEEEDAELLRLCDPDDPDSIAESALDQSDEEIASHYNSEGYEID